MIDKFFKLNRVTSLDDYDKRWIQANTKECPNCHQKIQKSQGCNYMLCDKRAGGCGKAFCYVCETDWELHSKDHFKCNKYTEAVKKKEIEAKQIQKDLDHEIKKFERYDFYYPRYMNYKTSVEVCKTTFKSNLEEKIQLLMFLQELPALETKFIMDALEALIISKRTLKNTYIFGYYMKDSNNKKLFEYSQGILEYYTENLHKSLLDSSLNFYEKGNMLTGWLTDSTGKKYFLDNDLKELGKLTRGWKKIDNNYYFFDDKGILFTSGITPDGYRVSSLGVWVS